MPQQAPLTVFNIQVGTAKGNLEWYCTAEAADFTMVGHVSTANQIRDVISVLIKKNDEIELINIQQLIQKIQSLKIKPQDTAYFTALSSTISSYLAEHISFAGMSFTH